MKLTIKPNFRQADIAKNVADFQKRLEEVLLMQLQKVGEEFVTLSRLNGSYQDQTGNLRSSIGYIIYKSGNIVFSSFPGEKAEGVSKARAFVNRLMRRDYANVPGLILICVSGMEYSLYVEATGREVISGSSATCQQMLKQAIERIKQKVA